MRIWRTFTVSLYILFWTATASAATTTKPPFPRLATVNYSNPMNYDDATYQANLARFHIALINYYPGWDIGRSMSMNKVVQNIKQINPQTSVFLYINNNEVNTSSSSLSDLTSKLNAARWWLFPSVLSGSPVPSAWAGALETNTTLFAPPDSNGDRWVDWYAKWVTSKYYVPNPSIDGFFTDNVFERPRVTGDWNLDGVSDNRNDPTVGQWYRDGYNHHFSVLNKLMPGKLQLANASDWGVSNANLSGLTGISNGGLMEAMIGLSYSAETWGGWAEMMSEYRKVMAAMGEPKLLIFAQVGVANDYPTFRYGFTSCLMDDGYYEFSLAANVYSGVFWFDEFDAKLGNSITGPSTAAWQKGVYRRDFENGIALVNPKGNGTQTVQLETQFKRIAGKQDPSTNNGQLTQTVTLKERDGIILLRTTPQAARRPLPPTSVVVH